MIAVFLYSILYTGGIVFLAGCVVRAVRYSREPLHLRWEVYPVPHSRTDKLRIMIPEILFLKGLWEFNRRMWYVSYPFHLGLYLMAAAFAVLVGAAAAPAGLAAAVRPLYTALGTAGTVLGLAGALGLLHRRLSSPELRIYSTRGDYFNLVFFSLTFVLLLAGEWLRAPDTPGLLAILRGAFTFDTALQPPALLAAGLAAAALLAAYIPMTHMAHFIAKYFLYHNVRWDERDNVAGGTIERHVAEYLMYRPTWAAPHIGAGGRTWTEIATRNPARGGRDES